MGVLDKTSSTIMFVTQVEKNIPNSQMETHANFNTIT